MQKLLANALVGLSVLFFGNLAFADCRLVGMVQDQANNPLPGVNVISDPGGVSGVTDSMGRYSLFVMNSGFYTVKASKAGYLPNPATSQGVQASHGADTMVPPIFLTLTTGGSGSIRVKVLDQVTSNGINGAAISVDRIGSQTTPSPGQPAGEVLFPMIPPGSYTVNFVLPPPMGWNAPTPLNQPVSVTANQESVVTFWLTRSNQPPVPQFTMNGLMVDTITVSTGVNVNFDASSSNDPDGSIAAYAWVFGDGGTGSGMTTAHAYQNAGTFKVRLTVTDNLGATGFLEKTVTVTAAAVANRAPVFSVLPLGSVSVNTGQGVTLQASATDD